MKKSKKILSGFWGLVLIIFGIISTGCVTSFHWDELDLSVENTPHSKIHKLRSEDVGLEIEFQRKVEDIMRDFFDSRGEEYGYYTVDFVHQTQDPNTITGGQLALAFFSGLTLFTLNILGMPITQFEYRLNAYLQIFDSAGDLVQIFQNSKRFKVTYGLYYGNLKEAMEKNCSESLSDLIKRADREAETINTILEVAGPITPQNTAAARSKIHRRLVSEGRN
jgi:hypothetical protein